MIGRPSTGSGAQKKKRGSPGIPSRSRAMKMTGAHQIATNPARSQGLTSEPPTGATAAPVGGLRTDVCYAEA